MGRIRIQPMIKVAMQWFLGAGSSKKKFFAILNKTPTRFYDCICNRRDIKIIWNRFRIIAGTYAQLIRNSDKPH